MPLVELKEGKHWNRIWVNGAEVRTVRKDAAFTCPRCKKKSTRWAVHREWCTRCEAKQAGANSDPFSRQIDLETFQARRERALQAQKRQRGSRRAK